MTKDEEKRAAIIAAQAARAALLPPVPFRVRRRNWAASAPKPPTKRPYFAATKGASDGQAHAASPLGPSATGKPPGSRT